MGSSRRRALSFQTSSSKDVGVDGLTNDLSKESHGTSQFDSQIVWVNTVCSHTMCDLPNLGTPSSEIPYTKVTVRHKSTHTCRVSTTRPPRATSTSSTPTPTPSGATTGRVARDDERDV